MTEAAFKNKKNIKPSAGNRISTHPSYTEYSWDTLVNTKKTADNVRSGSADMNNTAQNPRVGTGAAAPAAAGTASRRPTASGKDVYSRKVGQSTRTAVGTSRNNTASRSAAAVKAKPGEKSIEKIRRKSIVAIHTIAVDKKYSFPLSIVLIALCFTVLIMATVTTSVQINEITAVNSSLQREYNTLVSEENELRLLLETRDDLRVVETIAKEELGMVKKDQVERYYLTVHKEDRIEIVENVEQTSPGFFDGIMSFGGNVVERIRGFFGM